MVLKVESMDIYLQPFVQRKADVVLGGLHVPRQIEEEREHCKMCLSGFHSSPMYSYMCCIAFGLVPDEVAATCVHSSLLQLSCAQTAWKTGS